MQEHLLFIPKKLQDFVSFYQQNSKEYMWEWIPRFPARKEFTDMDTRPEIPDSMCYLKQLGMSLTVCSVSQLKPGLYSDLHRNASDPQYTLEEGDQRFK